MMTVSSRDSILNFELNDPASGLNFSQRLARENRWSQQYTARVVTEYLRFLVLCKEAGHKVTPSEAVDQAWHLHLCYTESYWNDLCRDTIGVPIHHGPTKGGAQERTKFNDWYERTLDSYRRLFGEEPPADIWPSAKIRFARQDVRRVDFGANFVIPKKALVLSLLGLGGATGLAGCAPTLLAAGSGKMPMFLFLGILLIVVLICIAIFKNRGGGGGGGKGGGGGLGSIFVINGASTGCSGGSDSGFDSDGGGSSGCGGGGGCGGGCGG